MGAQLCFHFLAISHLQLSVLSKCLFFTLCIPSSVPKLLVDLHVKLLRKIGKSVSADRWEKYLVKVNVHISINHGLKCWWCDVQLVVDPKHFVCRGLLVKDIISLLYHSSNCMLVMSLCSLEKSPFHSCRTCWSDYFITLKQIHELLLVHLGSSLVIKYYKEEFWTFYSCQWTLNLVCWLDWYFSDGLCRCVRSLIQHGRGNSNRKDTRRCRQNAKQPYWKSALPCFISVFSVLYLSLHLSM